MKKYLFPALALGLVMTSCQSDEPFAPGEGGEKQVTFTLNVPGELGTRAATGNNSGVGGLSNNAGELSYTLVLDADGDQRKFTKTGAGSVVFNPTVVLGREYTVTAYAHFGEAWDGATAIDITKHFNDETKDAYFQQENIKFQLNETNKQITLKRPFGKLRLLATDYIADGNQLNTAVKNVKITYNDAQAAKFDVFDSEFEFDGNYVNADAKTFGYYAAEDGAMPIFADYVPANPGDNMVDFTVEVTYTNGETYSRTFNDIPVKRNALTTLKGNFFTAGAEITVEVDDDFENVGENGAAIKWDGTTTPVVEKNGTYAVSTASELAWIAGVVNGTITRAEGDDFKGKTIVLMEDIDLDNKEWTPIGTAENPFKGTFDAYGNTIKNLVITGNNSNVGLFGFTTEGEIKNLVVENAKVSGRLNVGVVAGTPYTSKYTNITVKGHVEVKGMAYVGAVGGKNAYANWTNITVNVDETSYVNANSVENGVAYRTYVGGVVGFMGEGGHTMRNVTSNIDVKGSTIDVGGIVGIAHYGNNFVNVTCTGDVEIYNAGEEAEAQQIGGIAGVWNNGGSNVTFTNCSFGGNLKANNNYTINTNKFGNLVCAAYSADGTGKLIIDGTEYMQTSEGVTINGALVVETAAALQDAIQAGKDVVLSKDLTISATEMLVAPYGNKTALIHNGGVFNGNNKTISATIGGDNYAVMTNGGTIKNLTVNNGFRGIMIMSPSQTITLENVVSSGEGVCYALNTGEGDSSQDLIATNCTFNGWSSWSLLKSATFTNCKFGQGAYYTNVSGRLGKPYVNTLFDGCDFCSKFYIDLSSLGDNQKVTLKNCTVNGVKLTTQNWTSLIAPENTCGNGQISIELKNGTYLTADNLADYIIIE